MMMCAFQNLFPLKDRGPTQRRNLFQNKRSLELMNNKLCKNLRPFKKYNRKFQPIHCSCINVHIFFNSEKNGQGQGSTV